MRTADAIQAMRLGETGGLVFRRAGERSYSVFRGDNRQAAGTINATQFAELQRDYLLYNVEAVPGEHEQPHWAMPLGVLAYLVEQDAARARAMEYVVGARAVWVHKGISRINVRLGCTIVAHSKVSTKVRVLRDDSGQDILVDRIRLKPCVYCPLCEGAVTAETMPKCPCCFNQGLIPSDAIPLPGDLPQLAAKILAAAPA